jgi:hypothetical protein
MVLESIEPGTVVRACDASVACTSARLHLLRSPRHRASDVLELPPGVHYPPAASSAPQVARPRPKRSYVCCASDVLEPPTSSSCRPAVQLPFPPEAQPIIRLRRIAGAAVVYSGRGRRRASRLCCCGGGNRCSRNDLRPEGRSGRATRVFCALVSTLPDDAWIVAHGHVSQSIAGIEAVSLPIHQALHRARKVRGNRALRRYQR